MEIKSPCIITPSLMAGVEIAGAWISIEYSENPGREGRTRYRYQIVLPGGKEETGEDLESGVTGGNLQQGLESLLCFLSDPASFSPAVRKWARQYSDEIEMIRLEVEETPDCIIE
jgi:hypothetical protein